MKLERLLQVDRRVIFLILGLVIILPILFPVNLPVGAQKVSKSFFETVDAIDRERQCLMISIDYDPQTEAELQPMLVALLRHCFARRLPVVTLALYVQGTGLMNAAIQQTMGEFNARATSAADSIIYGRDVVFLGWQPPPIVPILSMGESIAKVYPVDFVKRVPLETLPLMKRIKNYDNVGLVAAISSGSSPNWYFAYAQPKFGVKVGAAVTAVSAPDLYPYFQTGQLSGILGGMKGAAEYEYMVYKKYSVGGRRRAMEGMGSQSAAHLLIMAFVILGNIAFFLGKRKGRSA
jgi:hypothetical protein